MSGSDIVAVCLLGAFLFIFAIATAWTAGREQGRSDVLDHGWKRKNP